MRWILTYLKSRYPNFHTVVPKRLYRSATPKPDDLEQWHEVYGIKTWLDLRMPKDYIDDPSFFAAQCAIARRLGIERISLPLDDFGVVTDEQVRVGLEILTDETKQPILFGCKGGRHRAGLLCAMYRERIEDWRPEIAMAEAKRCGYYPNGHRTFDKRFRQLLGLLLVLLMAVPALGQGTPAVMTPENFSIKQAPEHPFIKPNQVVEPVRAEPVRNPYKFDRSFWVASGLWFGGSTADLVTTKFALDRGGIEANPLHAQDGGHKLRWSSAITASVGTWSFAAYCERKGHRRVARIVLITGAIVRTGLAFWNNSRRR